MLSYKRACNISWILISTLKHTTNICGWWFQHRLLLFICWYKFMVNSCVITIISFHVYFFGKLNRPCDVIVVNHFFSLGDCILMNAYQTTITCLENCPRSHHITSHDSFQSPVSYLKVLLLQRAPPAETGSPPRGASRAPRGRWL